jgi:hypothetical protein
MTSTSTHTSRAVSRTASGLARSAGSQALRAAGRQLLATAGNQVLNAAVDRAVGKVDHVAGRLDAVAAGERSARPRPPANRKPPQRRAEQREGHSVNPVKVKMGAAFSLIMQQALRLLHLIRRLAQQLLAAVSRLVKRNDDAASSTTDVTESRRVDRMVPRDRVGKVNKAERADGRRTAERPRPFGGQPARAPHASPRQGPRPAAREAAGAPRRSAGDRPVRAARND